MTVRIFVGMRSSSVSNLALFLRYTMTCILALYVKWSLRCLHFAHSVVKNAWLRDDFLFWKNDGGQVVKTLNKIGINLKSENWAFIWYTSWEVLLIGCAENSKSGRSYVYSVHFSHASQAFGARTNRAIWKP